MLWGCLSCFVRISQIVFDNLKLRERLENLQVNLRRFVPQEALSFLMLMMSEAGDG